MLGPLLGFMVTLALVPFEAIREVFSVISVAASGVYVALVRSRLRRGDASQGGLVDAVVWSSVASVVTVFLVWALYV